METTAPEKTSSGPRLKAGGVCPHFPGSLVTVAHTAPFAAPVVNLSFASFRTLAAVRAQAQARGRISFSRSRQKRGPPAVSSLT